MMDTIKNPPQSKKSTSMAAASTMVPPVSELSDTELREKLKIHFNHTDFKSKLQHDAIRTIIKRKNLLNQPIM